MSRPKILILEENDLTAMTVCSLEKNCPQFKYRVIQNTGSRVGSALREADGVSLVVRSGTVLFLKDGDLPPAETINKYAITVSRSHVFDDHSRLCSTYEAINKVDNEKNSVDLSVFMINPAAWDEPVSTDKGVMEGRKRLFMPRYMNHKTDLLFEHECLGGRDAVVYGMLGKKASVLNYVGKIILGKANVIESYAYNFDRLLGFCDNLSPRYRDSIEHLATLSKRMSKFRDALFEAEERYLNGH